MFVFRKNWRVLFSCNTRFKICPLPYYRQNNDFFFEGKSIHVKSRRKINLQILHARFYKD